jgi:hypothetical protein
MTIQDVLIAAFVIISMVTVYGVARGRNHVASHVWILVSALFPPFICFRWDKLDQVPAQAWAVCATLIVAQCLYTAFHILRPKLTHARSPETFFQIGVAMWAVSVRHMADPDIWYRGWVGMLFFCFANVYISTAVLMSIYLGGAAELPTDRMNVPAYGPFAPGNAGLLAGSATAMMFTLWATFDNPLLLLGAGVAFATCRYVLPIREQPPVVA